MPLMASFSMSRVLLDPEISSAYQSKEEVKMEHSYSTTLWDQGGQEDRIRTIHDLMDEMDEEQALKDDSSDEDKDREAMERDEAGRTQENEEEGGMSVREMIQVIESQKRTIKYLTNKCQTQEDEKESIIESFKQSTSMLLERLKDLES